MSVEVNSEALQSAAHAVQTADREKAVFGEVEHLRLTLRREAEECALDSLYHLSARGAEWYPKGDTILASVPEAAAGTDLAIKKATVETAETAKSLVAAVFASTGERINNDVASAAAEGKPYERVEPRTRSEMAVPLWCPDEKDVIGVFNLESNERGAFLEVRARELRRECVRMHPRLEPGEAAGEVLPCGREGPGFAAGSPAFLHHLLLRRGGRQGMGARGERLGLRSPRGLLA